jgi:hypothetical protein
MLAMTAHVFRPRLSHPIRGLCLMALAAGSLLFPWPGQRVCATEMMSWFLTQANTPPAGGGTSPFATATLTVTGQTATFDVAMSPSMASAGYKFSEFAFNWAGVANILGDGVTTGIIPPSGWQAAGSPGSGTETMDGFGKFNYKVDVGQGGNNLALNPLHFTLNLGFTGLSESQIFTDLSSVTSSGASGSGLFAAHAVAPSGTPTLFLGGTVPVPEPGSLLLLSGSLAGLGFAGAWKRWRKVAPVPN